LGTGAMLMAEGIVTLFALTTQLRPHPWYDPRYAIPLLGMVLGNTMNGISLGLNALTGDLGHNRAAVEARLALGADRWQAMRFLAGKSLRMATTPIVNSMAATGLVSLPGMMTGQILGGVAPFEAVKYQILVMFLIAGGTGIGAVAAIGGGVLRLTDHRHRLRLDRLG
ncbi:ABC transporter permease, partial [Trichlorobacter lovleyi]|uniref:ABC transporter permease n=1 Tax=Trichlorobacter lovleyi TaxID=313985 RepID=UPI0023F1E8B7